MRDILQWCDTITTPDCKDAVRAAGWPAAKGQLMQYGSKGPPSLLSNCKPFTQRPYAEANAIA